MVKLAVESERESYAPFGKETVKVRRRALSVGVILNRRLINVHDVVAEIKIVNIFAGKFVAALRLQK